MLYCAFCYEASESLILFLMIPEFRFDNKNAYRYDAYSGCLHYWEFYSALRATPITIYEF